jgi:mannose-6-phosphate isomerase-like protein (cupin superfamily)
MIHEDERRILEDWPEAKVITAKKDCVLGEHYHKIKTEKFILTLGTARIVIDGETIDMKVGEMYIVNPFEVHTFLLRKGSVLVGLCSHKYTPSDDYTE